MSTTIAQIVVVRGFWASFEASGRRHRPIDGSNGLKNHFLKKVIFLNFGGGPRSPRSHSYLPERSLKLDSSSLNSHTLPERSVTCVRPTP